MAWTFISFVRLWWAGKAVLFERQGVMLCLFFVRWLDGVGVMVKLHDGVSVACTLLLCGHPLLRIEYYSRSQVT